MEKQDLPCKNSEFLLQVRIFLTIVHCWPLILQGRKKLSKFSHGDKPKLTCKYLPKIIISSVTTLKFWQTTFFINNVCEWRASHENLWAVITLTNEAETTRCPMIQSLSINPPKYFDFFSPSLRHCTMCILSSTMALWSKAEIQKYTFWWEKNIFEAIFPMLF